MYAQVCIDYISLDLISYPVVSRKPSLCSCPYSWKGLRWVGGGFFRCATISCILSYYVKLIHWPKLEIGNFSRLTVLPLSLSVSLVTPIPSISIWSSLRLIWSARFNLVWSPKPVWSFCIICHMNKFQLSLAHLWTDFQSSYFWETLIHLPKVYDGVWMKLLPVFQWHQWTAQQCQGKLNSAPDKSSPAQVGLGPVCQDRN